jgi:hypothetical protein
MTAINDHRPLENRPSWSSPEWCYLCDVPHYVSEPHRQGGGASIAPRRGRPHEGRGTRMDKTVTQVKKSNGSQPKPLNNVEDLAAQVQVAVRHATGNRIHNLAVHVNGTHIILDGFCSTYHCNQIAQHAAMRSAQDLRVDNRIEVL